MKNIKCHMENISVGVGIEPTSRVFQTRANPSQLSDQKAFPISDCQVAIWVFGLWPLVLGLSIQDHLLPAV
jgi:hypothetical protein